MTTNPIITNKLEEFVELCLRYNVGGKARLATRAFLSQAIEEAYLAGMNDERRNNIDTAFEVAGIATDIQHTSDLKKVRTEAQLETAREILEWIKENKRMLCEEYSCDAFAENLEFFILSRYSKPGSELCRHGRSREICSGCRAEDSSNTTKI